MKLSNISVIFIIIIIPIILVTSYYISLQADTINMQTAYNSKQLDATKSAIEAFEINTVEWNEAYSTTSDSKRRDVMASINTFTTSFANSLGIGGTSKEDILAYIPAIACTLYDGYYIYSPADTKEVVKDENGVAVVMSEALTTEKNAEGKKIINSYDFNQKDEGKLLYQVEDGKAQSGTYNGMRFTLDPKNAKSTYKHILKPFSPYSARYKKGNKIDIIVNYTLDNYITIYGTIDEGKNNITKSGYLINTDATTTVLPESLSEIVWYEGLSQPQQYDYVYASDNTKMYFDNDNTAFQVSSTNIRTNLTSTTGVKYKKIITETETEIETIYQALNDGSIKKKNEEGKVKTIEIKQGDCFVDMNGTQKEGVSYELKKDYSAQNYYIETKKFTEWVKTNLGDITVDNMQDVDDKSLYGNLNDCIFKIGEDNDPESEDSVFTKHKRAVIKQSLISNLNQAITSYSRNSSNEFKLPVLTETDWDHIYRNVSIITFVQGLPIGAKIYNNYTVATSTANKEFINPDEIYLTGDDDYYHKPYCDKLKGDNIIGYRNTDYVIKSYIQGEDTKYYYKHSKNQACYYCLVQRSLYKEEVTDKKELAYKTALARERYNKRIFK